MRQKRPKRQKPLLIPPLVAFVASVAGQANLCSGDFSSSVRVDRSYMPYLTLRPLGGFSGRKLYAVETCGVWRSQETSCPSIVQGSRRRLIHPSHSDFWAGIVCSELRRL